VLCVIMPLSVHPSVFSMPAVHILVVHFVNLLRACLLFARRDIVFPFFVQGNKRTTNAPRHNA
jgi:hypothetical protein